MAKSLKAETLDRKRHADRVMHNWRATQARRAQLANDFRAQLTRELGDPEPSASRAALIAVAVSAYVQISELSARFSDGRLSVRGQTALSLARGQLQRALTALGLTRDAGDSDGQPGGAELAAYIASKEQVANDNP